MYRNDTSTKIENKQKTIELKAKREVEEEVR